MRALRLLGKRMLSAGLGEHVDAEGIPRVPLPVDHAFFMTILGLCQERISAPNGEDAAAAGGGAAAAGGGAAAPAGAATASQSTVYGYVSALKYYYTTKQQPYPSEFDLWGRTFLEGTVCG